MRHETLRLREGDRQFPAMQPSPLSTATGTFRQIITLIWPQLLMMLAQYCVTLADVVATGRMGMGVQASLGLVSGGMFLFLVVPMALATGAVALVSQSLGAGLGRRARRYGCFTLFLGLSSGLALTLAFSPVRTPLLGLLRVPSELLPVADCFLGAYLLALPFYSLLLCGNAIFQAHGLVRVPLCSMCVAALLNALLDFGLGLGLWGLPALGHTAVAWATFFSVGTAAALNGYFMRRWRRSAWGRLWRCAWPAGAAQVVGQGGILALFVLLGAHSSGQSGPLAGFTAGLRIEALLSMPAHALGLAAAIMTGRRLGAGDRAGTRRMALRILGLGAGGLTLAAFGLWLLLEPTAALVSPDHLSSAWTVSYLNWALAVSPCTAGSIILSGVLSGAGAGRLTLVSLLVSAGLARLPLAYALIRMDWFGAKGVWVALAASQVCHFLLLLHALLYRNWQGGVPKREHPSGHSCAERLSSASSPVSTALARLTMPDRACS